MKINFVEIKLMKAYPTLQSFYINKKLYFIVYRKIKKVIFVVEPALIDLLKDHILCVLVGNVSEHDCGSSIVLNIVKIYLIVIDFRKSHLTGV